MGLNANAQVTYPDNIFASTNQAQLHELVLKATQENGQTTTVASFEVDLTNVVSAPANSELAIFTTDNSLSINEAKVKTTTDAFIDLVKQSQNSFSLTGLHAGVYTIDVITQKGNARAAYEGILVLGQEPTNVQTRTIIEQQIVRENNDDDDGNNGNGSEGNCDPSYPNVCIRPYPPDLDCPEIQYTGFKVLPPDPHDFDREGDGIGCEAGTRSISDIVQDGNETLLPPPDPCLVNPNLPECLVPCIENPNAVGCNDPCETNPDAEECQEPPPIGPCEEDPSPSQCQEEDTEDGTDEEESDEDSSDDENGDESDESSGNEDEGNGDEGSGDGDGDEDSGDDDAGAEEDGTFG